jgi:hypothetical protein
VKLPHRTCAQLKFALKTNGCCLKGGKMTKNEILTENGVQCQQAKHTNREALQMPKLATQQDEIEMHDDRSLYALLF